MSISDLLGLETPPATNPNLQLDIDDAKFSPTGLSFSDGTPSPPGKYSLNLSLGTNSPPTTPSDTCGRNSSLMLDQSLLNNVNSCGDSPESDSSNIDGSICDNLNSLTLNDSTLARNLLPRTEKPACYSRKVFLGGLPWDISEQELVQTFKQFGPIRVEWLDIKEKQVSQPKGYVFIFFESEKNVKALLQGCTNDCNNSWKWYYNISLKRMKSMQELQVIPWDINDSNYTKFTTQKLNPATTVFVGALPGMLTAQGLARIMNDLFDGVVYTGIDTDKYKYPIGSGRVTFNNPLSYMKAVAAGFIEINDFQIEQKGAGSSLRRRICVRPALLLQRASATSAELAGNGSMAAKATTNR